jgi:hypothetical protein
MKTKIFLSIILSALLMSCATYIDLTKQVWAKIPKEKKSQIQFYNSGDVTFTYQRNITDSMDVEKGKLVFIDKDIINLRRLKAHTPGVLSTKETKWSTIGVQFDTKLPEGIPFSVIEESNNFRLQDYFIFDKKEYKTNSSGVTLQVRKKDLYNLEPDFKTYKGIKVGK